MQESEIQKDHMAHALVQELKKNQSIIPSSYDWALQNNFVHVTLIGVLKSLEAKDIVVLKQNKMVQIELTASGEHTLKNGSSEAILWEKIGTQVIPPSACAELLGLSEVEASQAMAQALKRQYLMMNDEKMLMRHSKEISDWTRKQCEMVGSIERNLEKSTLEQLKRRQLVNIKTITEYSIEMGSHFENFGMISMTDLTDEMLATGAWKTAQFKRYNFNSLGAKPLSGALHPLMKIRQEFRDIFLELGFEEMPTNRYVESSFWNFDALFQPQFHPTRDAHDTFFIEDPSNALSIPTDYMKMVKQFHEVGGCGSIGYRYQWQEQEALKNVLRTHTTAVSARMLNNLAEEYKKTGVFTPKKYFSIDRVFRNEATDATHLAEFHQCEGVIADYNLTLRDLIGVLEAYFHKQGLTGLKFKSTCNPYTEPSMEVYCFHQSLGKLVEIGNSGMFRPEMLLAMGLPANVRVLGWGVSLERPAMIKYGIKDIRTLIGPDVSYDFICENPICRIDHHIAINDE